MSATTCLGPALLQLHNIDRMIVARDTEVLEGNPVLILLFQPQIPQALAWDRTRASKAIGRRSSGGATVRSNKEV